MQTVAVEHSDELSIKIMAFESTTDVVQYMSGDHSVKPIEEDIVSGENAEKKTEAHK